MSDDTNLDNRRAQGRWESVHANDFALLDTPEQRIGFLKELLDNLKKGIGEAKGRPPALTAVDAEALSKGRHCADLAYFKDEESIAQLERECSDPALSESDREKRTYLVELARRYWAAQDRQREDEQAWQMSRSLEADQRLLITKLDEARLDEAKREEARAPAPPQPVPQEPPEPEVEKIDFNGSVAQFVYLWGILYEIDNGLSKHQNQRRWALLAKHFTIKGKEVKSSNLAATARNIGLNKTGKPKTFEVYDAVKDFIRDLPEEERDIIMRQPTGK